MPSIAFYKHICCDCVCLWVSKCLSAGIMGNIMLFCNNLPPSPTTHFAPQPAKAHSRTILILFANNCLYTNIHTSIHCFFFLSVTLCAFAELLKVCCAAMSRVSLLHCFCNCRYIRSFIVLRADLKFRSVSRWHRKHLNDLPLARQLVDWLIERPSDGAAARRLNYYDCWKFTAI